MGFGETIGNVFKSFAKQVSEDNVSDRFSRHTAKNVFGFYAPAENSGTTSLVCNIAEVLRGFGSPVLIMDFNFECPCAFKYFQDELESKYSFSRKLRNPALEITELLGVSGNNIDVITMTGEEMPSQYCEVPIDLIRETIRQVSTMYKYVLIDLGTSANHDATNDGLCECDKVYSVVTPNIAQISKLLVTKQALEPMGHYNKIKDVIQTIVHSGMEFPESEFADIGLNLIGNVPFDPDLARFSSNFKVVSGGRSRNVSNYVKLVQAVANDIKTIVSNTDYVAKNEETSVDEEDE